MRVVPGGSVVLTGSLFQMQGYSKWRVVLGGVLFQVRVVSGGSLFQMEGFSRWTVVVLGEGCSRWRQLF